VHFRKNQHYSFVRRMVNYFSVVLAHMSVCTYFLSQIPGLYPCSPFFFGSTTLENMRRISPSVCLFVVEFDRSLDGRKAKSQRACGPLGNESSAARRGGGAWSVCSYRSSAGDRSGFFSEQSKSMQQSGLRFVLQS
jgi:hypothetical protein